MDVTQQQQQQHDKSKAEDFSQALSQIGVEVWVPVAPVEQAGRVVNRERLSTKADLTQISAVAKHARLEVAPDYTVDIWVAYDEGQSDLRPAELDLLINMFKAIGYEDQARWSWQPTDVATCQVTLLLGLDLGRCLLGNQAQPGLDQMESVAVLLGQPVLITHALYQILADRRLKRPVWEVLQQLQQIIATGQG